MGSSYNVKSCLCFSLRVGTIIIGVVGILVTGAMIGLLSWFLAEKLGTQNSFLGWLAIIAAFVVIILAVPYFVFCFPLIAGAISENR